MERFPPVCLLATVVAEPLDCIVSPDSIRFSFCKTSVHCGILPENPRREFSSMASPRAIETAPRLTGVQWLICVIASLGFAFDTYELLVLPLIVRPALMEM